MTLTDWIGFTGVAILLVAYLLNLTKLIHQQSIAYLGLNVLGAGIACLASVLIHYMPFVLLEGCWTLVSAVGILNYLRKK